MHMYWCNPRRSPYHRNLRSQSIHPGTRFRKTGKRVISEAELSAMEAKVAAWAARSITDTSGSDCKSGCTGACYTGCATGCTGCGSG